MSHTAARTRGRLARHRRIRKKVVGMPDRPRVCIFRSNRHLQVQLVDDVSAKTLVGCSTMDKRLSALRDSGGTKPAAVALGKLVAEEAVKQGITKVVFDRGGYRYHGRVEAFANALRAGGLQL